MRLTRHPDSWDCCAEITTPKNYFEKIYRNLDSVDLSRIDSMVTYTTEL